MSETVQNATTQPSSSSVTSSPVSHTQPSNEPSVKTPTKEEIVKSLVQQGSKKYEDKKSPTEAVKPEEKKVETKSEASKSDAKPDDPQSKKLDSDKTKPESPKPDLEGDPKLAARIAAIAEAESKAKTASAALAKERQTFETEKAQHKENVTSWQRFTTEFPQDPVKALTNLGLKNEHLDALYWRLNADVLQRTKDGKPSLTESDVEERARKIAAEEFKRLQEDHGKQSQQQFEAAMTEAKRQYIGKVATAFEGAKDKFPAVAALGVNEGDIHSYVEAQYKEKQVIPTPEEVLTHFESEHQKRIEAVGYKKPQVEAPKAEEKKPITSSKTVTADWQAGSSPTSEKTTSQSLKESRDEIKKKLEAGFFKRQRA